ncbi:MAG: hypothetical protein JNK00_05335 [Flavipsychrobacter sp.]|nr:hypothetical protein [Flavipsychrobacter sp.]
MKKFNTLFVLIGCTMLFIACKKDYTCKCTAKIDIPGVATVSADSSYTISKTTKKNAKNNCTDTENKLKPEIQAEGGTISCAVN